MEKRHYSDFFKINERYRPNMTRETINETVDTWLDFYPHEKFVEFFSTLLETINGGHKSIWLTGNLGTGKSHAALVTQKLFSDDEERVKKWFEKYKRILDCNSTLFTQLNIRRYETLVVYDYNASGMGSDADFLVRLEKGIVDELKARKMIVPPKANLDEIIKRLHREGQNFFKMRDSIQSELSELKPVIKTIDQLVSLLQSEKIKSTPNNLLMEVQKVLHRDNIYLDIRVPAFRKWVNAILIANKLKRIVYVFDEFANFIDRNRGDLKTFEEVTEAPQTNKFFLVPVTHMNIDAYLAEGSDSALKANERFYFCKLQMPNDTAFKLAATAIIPQTDNFEIAEEWKKEKDLLWSDVRGITEVNFSDDDISKDSFYNILPIHPMAAFLLKVLAESAQSNQRSIFEYLKGSANGREFQDFIKTGGPTISGKQFLTVDYLWKYFIERNDLGISKEITSIRNEFERIKNREFRNRDSDDEEIRVLKTALLFCLLSRLQPNGHERLRPTIQNIVLSFQGDSAIVNVAGILKELERKHCFNIINENIELFTSSVGGQDARTKAEEYNNKFDELLSDACKKTIEEKLKKTFSSFSQGRFDVRVSDIGKATLSDFPAATRENYGYGREKDNGATCLWFIIAKNKSEQLHIPGNIDKILSQLHDHRILMFAFPETSFCENNAEQWDEYVYYYAQWVLENGDEAKKRRKVALEQIEKSWLERIKNPDTLIKVYSYKDGKVINDSVLWGLIKSLLENYIRKNLKYCPDFIVSQIAAFDTRGFKSWALSGINFIPETPQHGAVVAALKEQGINESNDWFRQNPEHPFAQIRAIINKKIISTVEKGANLSIKQVFRELQRAPFGLKFNALSAFALGFTLRYLLESNYQWTNLQMTNPLTKTELAEIIENAIKDNLQSKSFHEKLICRLSDDEKVFIEKASLMFGFANPSGDDTVEKTLLRIQGRIEKDFGRVPLWVFAEYVQNREEGFAIQISDVLNKICRAGSTSAKGNVEERSNFIKEVGKQICKNDSLVQLVAKYVKPENSQDAFWAYVDKIALPLKKLAEEVGDVSHDYCRILLAKSSETAGFLWNKADISREIDDTIQEYEVIKIAQKILGVDGFITYKSTIDNLRNAITQTNKLPKILIVSALPTIGIFLDSIFDNSATEEIKYALFQNANIIKGLFFDSKRAKTLEILYSRLDKKTIDEPGLLSVLNDMGSFYYEKEAEFWAEIQKHIDAQAQQSIVCEIKREWERLTDTATPLKWEKDNKIPARFALGNIVESGDIIDAVEVPEKFSASKLRELLETTKNLLPISVADCQKSFIAETVPKKYSKLNISLSSLLTELSGKYGNPRNWQPRPDISAFIHNEYGLTFAPQAIEIIKKCPVEELRQKLIRAVQNNAEIGLLFLEDE
ncbi:MAG: hypothetical protein LBQ40_02545 [Clostridiales bacterium]|jgi:hypothetical protein|nr:hypothetical protein [Clostridiales bacterium]